VAFIEKRVALIEKRVAFIKKCVAFINKRVAFRLQTRARSSSVIRFIYTRGAAQCYPLYLYWGRGADIHQPFAQVPTGENYGTSSYRYRNALHAEVRGRHSSHQNATAYACAWHVEMRERVGTGNFFLFGMSNLGCDPVRHAVVLSTASMFYTLTRPLYIDRVRPSGPVAALC
jgi:hypothetical protein